MLLILGSNLRVLGVTLWVLHIPQSVVDPGPGLPRLQLGAWPRNYFNSSFVPPKITYKNIDLALPDVSLKYLVLFLASPLSCF